MGYWLFKEEPTHYNFADLERDGKAVWNGVHNTWHDRTYARFARATASSTITPARKKP
jgi:predicted RNA-binding protein with PUA-like domain